MSIVEIKHFHLFCGLGGGARGFNQGEARVGNLQARFRCIGGVDVDRAAIADFGRMAGVPGTCLDMFDREQYRAFHGHEPPADWREAGPDAIRRAAGGERPHIVFLSAPCKGFSGLLSETRSKTGKYQALNRLTLRGVWLMLEAWADHDDGPPELIVFENVPRIATRGRHLLDQITGLLRSYGYAVAETTHDCGELGGLAQSRKRFLLVARHTAKVPPYLYEPRKRTLRAVGDVLGNMPMPGHLAAGPMHRMPALQWRTWLRLAFVEAGGDWRTLNRLRVEDGQLADYGIVPACTWQDGALGVLPWTDPAGVVTGNAGPTCGRFSVADPRAERMMRGDCLGVMAFDEPAGTVTSRGFPHNGRFAVADPRFHGQDYGQYGVRAWDKSMGAVSGQSAPGGGPYAVADPRFDGVRHNNIFRVVRFAETSPAVTGGGGPSAGGLAVADPRMPSNSFGKYGVTDFDDPAGTVISGSTTGQGAYAVADPRMWGGKDRENYNGGGHFGVLPWDATAGAVSASAGADNGRWSVADPRMPEPRQNLVAVIQALDGTWHRPFTTLELAALQGLVDVDEQLELDGLSDMHWRERIGNAVPPPAARAIAGVMGQVLLLTWSGETFSMGNTPIWVQPLVAGLMAAEAPVMGQNG
ncbi:C-5 cytosine-specific DNA methylase [Humidesulfovibrio mexicanus]|uniref:C-5 cytosine-specific DNA methylase n=1 Tax=Humidesulfovibrio mexicanus TaxID=147047 RepID=A0A239AVX5_9BACT|nr:DNA cytosine methyltransferase [Humidesulfovibrio mexicanus]SNR99876.1 C-5 cytosine-specific DNA methylase [Humidesulfovibrio mexicanus]